MALVLSIIPIVCCLAVIVRPAYANCGGFLDIKHGSDTGSLSSPNYPGSYPSWYRCIWYMQAPKNYNIKLEIGKVYGEYDASTSTCIDGLTVTNGSSELPVSFAGCRGETGSVLSPSRWLWIYFQSDKNEVVNTGFMANWTLVKSEQENELDKHPMLECKNVRNRCPNKECFAMAYRCDGMMDCGCDQEGCDEAECGTFEMSQTIKIVLGVSVGLAVFLIVFLGIGFLEILLKILAEREFKRKIHEQRMREKKKKSDKEVAEMVKLVERVERRESTLLRLDVPTSIRANSSISIKSAVSSHA